MKLNRRTRRKNRSRDQRRSLLGGIESLENRLLLTVMGFERPADLLLDASATGDAYAPTALIGSAGATARIVNASDGALNNTDPDPDPDPQPNPELDGDIHVNDVGPDATPIELEDGLFGFVDAMVNSDDDRDVFQITLTDAGTVYVDLFSWNGDLDTQLQVFDVDGEIVSDNNDSYDGTDSSLILELEAGTYYVMASSHDAASMGEYGLDVYVAPFGDIEDGELPCDDGFDDGWIVGDDEFDDGWTVGEDDWDWNDQDDHGLDAVDDDWDWTNDDAPWDVNCDGLMSAIDALLVVNYVNTGNGGALAPREAGSDSPYVDVSGDNFVGPVDVLLVINYLNQGMSVSAADAQQRIVNGQETSDDAAVDIVNDGCTGTLMRIDTLASWIDNVVGNANPDPDADPDPQLNPELDGDIHVNDVGPDATPIELEEGVFGFVDAMVNSDDDRDVFQITLTDAGTVYVDLFSWNGDLDTQLQVFDVDGAIVSDNNDSYGSTDSSLILELEAGAYYITASSHDASSMGEYGLDVYVESFSDFGDGDVDFSPEEAAQEELDQYDTNGDGMLSTEELVVEFLDYGDSAEDATAFAEMLINDFDTDGDNQLSLAELVASYEMWDEEVDPDLDWGDDEFDDGWIGGADDWDWSDQDDLGLNAVDDVMGEDIDWWSEAFGLV